MQPASPTELLSTVLLDLDGTLVDTAPDMGAALNALLTEHGRAGLTPELMRSAVSHGARGLIHRGFGTGLADELFDTLRERFLELYAERLCHGSRLFAGFEQVFVGLEARAIRWGVVTNKPAAFTEPLLTALGLTGRAACIVSGDTCARAKPDPMSLLHAAELVGAHPRSCVYVGDAERDMQAARAAGMLALVASYGYLDASDSPESWDPDGFINHPAELLEWIDARLGGSGG
jgi:phosphoglycolate phosphatase